MVVVVVKAELDQKEGDMVFTGRGERADGGKNPSGGAIPAPPHMASASVQYQ